MLLVFTADNLKQLLQLQYNKIAPVASLPVFPGKLCECHHEVCEFHVNETTDEKGIWSMRTELRLRVLKKKERKKRKEKAAPLLIIKG